MIRIRISREGSFADERDLFNMASKKSTKEEWIEKHDLFVSDDGTVFALVDTPNRVFFMDAVTGSLYEFGFCLSSMTLRAAWLRRNKAKAREILMAKVFAGAAA